MQSDPTAGTPAGSIEQALSVLLRALEEIRKAVESGAVGPDVEDVIDRASAVLAVVEDELRALEPADYPEAFEAASVMRARLARMRLELGIE